MTSKVAFALASATMALLVSSSARAQDMSAQASAEVLFTEGRQLMDQGKLAEACPKLGESQRLAPAVGTLLNLGICFEKNHQTASAWAAFREAVSAARAGGQTDRERYAREHAANLEPQLSKLTITIPPASDVDGLEVRRDGLVVGRAVWGSAIPVDPGVHTIDVSAPLRNKWSTSVDVGATAARALVTIPALEQAPAPPVAMPPIATPPHPEPSPTPPPERKIGNSQRMIGLALGGVGLAGVAVGSVAGLIAISKNDEALTHCDGTLCDARGLSLTTSARSSAAISTIGFGVGGAALATGVVLYLTAPSNKSTSAAASLRMSPSVGSRNGIVFGGTW